MRHGLLAALTVVPLVPLTLTALAALTVAACYPKPPPPKKPTVEAPSADETPDAGKEPECVGFQIDDLEPMLERSACEIPELPPDAASRNLEGILKIELGMSAAKVAPGGHLDVIVNFKNAGKDPLPLYFTVDPLPRFEVGVLDAKGNRVDMPHGNPPPPPKGVTPPAPPDAHIARVTIAPNGYARLRLPFEAVRTRWAPEKLKGSAGGPFPRAANGPLMRGKYKLVVVTPMVGVSEGVGHEISQPTRDVEIAQ